jgi:hypothetical protein
MHPILGLLRTNLLHPPGPKCAVTELNGEPVADLTRGPDHECAAAHAAASVGAKRKGLTKSLRLTKFESRVEQIGVALGQSIFKELQSTPASSAGLYSEET